MKIINHLDDITAPYRRAVVTIGNFDGVHRGHQVLMRKVVDKARQIGGTAIAITFEPHPIRVLKKNGQPPLITLYDQKTELIEKNGMDVLICIPFTPEFADLTAEQFVRELLVDRIGMKAIVVGSDYVFGKNREGDIDRLRSFAGDLDFEVIIVDRIQLAGVPGRISSTRIRKLVEAGRVTDARRQLGRDYQIRGKVVGGRDRGAKLLGFATANIRLHDELCPRVGIYAVTVECEGKSYDGVANIGYSPTFDDRLFTVEVHILDFQQDIYGKRIRVNFVERIRDEIKFDSIDALKAEIGRDVQKARDLLARRRESGAD